MAKDLKMQVMLSAVDKITKPLKAINSASQGTADALKENRDRIKQLQAVQKDISSFRALKAESADTSEALREQQNRIRHLSQQMQANQGDTSALAAERKKAIKQASKLAQSHDNEQRQLQQLRTSLNRSGVSTNNLTRDQQRLAGEMQQANQAVEEQQRKLKRLADQQAHLAKARRRYDNASSTGGSMMGAGAGMAAAGGGALALMTSQALGNQMAGSRLAAQLGEGTDAAKRYRDVISSVYTGGRGAGRDDVTNAVAASAAAFGSLEEQTAAQLKAITSQALTLSDVFGIDVAEAVQTAKIMVTNGLAKDATAAFDLLGRSFQKVPASMRAELPEIIHEYSTNFRAMGFNGKEAFNLLISAADQGKFALDKTGDAIKEFTIRGSDMSKTSVEAYKAIGLDAKKMSDAIANGGDGARAAMRKTAQAILAIKDPALRANTAIGLFGTPIEDLSVDQIPKFLRALGGTKDLLGEVTGATGEMADTLDNNAGKALKGILRAISGAFMPVLDGMQTEIIAASKAISGWIKENPELASTLAKVAAGLSLVVAVGGSLLILLGSIVGPIAMVNLALTALSMNPVMLTIIGIAAACAALAGAAYLIYRNWDKISAWFGARWNDVKTAFSGGIGSITRLLANWSPLGLLYRGITAALSALGVEIPEKFSTLGNAIVDGLIGGLGAKMTALKDKVVGIADSVGGWFADKLRIRSPSRVFAQYGRYTVDGLNVGLDAQRDEPAKRIRDIARRVAQAGAGLALGAATLPAAAMPGITQQEPIRFDTRPPLASQAGGQQYADHSTTSYTIHVTAAPGMDEQALAQVIKRELDARDRDRAARRRSSLRDID